MTTTSPALLSVRPWSRGAEAAAIVGFWTMLGVLTVVRRALDPRGLPGGTVFTPGVTLTLAEYVLWAAATPAIFALVRALPLEREVWVRRVALHLGLALAAAVLVEVYRFGVLQALLPTAWAQSEWARSDRLARRLERGGGMGALFLRPRLVDGLTTYLGILAAGFARDYFLRYRERAAETAQLRVQLAEARLAALRMQLNPHFLFNTLNTVSALAERDPAAVRTLVARLSALLRRVLDGSPSQRVPLREELALLRDYLDIQRIRFQDRLEVIEDVEPETLDALVPNLILQPLVENAVEHGASRASGTGRVTIQARRDANGTLMLRVMDNGPGAVRYESNGVGLRNTRDRLRTLYGETAALRLHPGDTGGTVAELALPLEWA